MNLGLAVSESTRDGVADSEVLLDAATALDLTARLVDWRSTEWDWADVVLLHAPWDYTDDPQGFSGWLKSLSAHKPVFNGYTSVAGNMHKSYLLDLVDAGLPLPLTRFLRSGRAIDQAELRATFGSSEVVVKPAVGAGGRRLCRLDSAEDLGSCPLVGALGVPLEDLMVQEFIPSVAAKGEYSLVMIAGRPSHLIHKMPAAGEFRVQSTYGGSERHVEMDDTAAGVARMMRSRVEKLAYARVDYVIDENDEPLLMELEVTEPDLFLRHFPDAAPALIRCVTGS